MLVKCYAICDGDCLHKHPHNSGDSMVDCTIRPCQYMKKKEVYCLPCLNEEQINELDGIFDV